MPTHATIIIKDDNFNVSFYKHSDGGLDSLGKTIAEFLNGLTIVNGFVNTHNKIANGMGCLAAQLCKLLKEEVGEFYIINYPNYLEDYNYRISNNFISVIDLGDNLLFMGSWEEFYQFVNK